MCLDVDVIPTVTVKTGRDDALPRGLRLEAYAKNQKSQKFTRKSAHCRTVLPVFSPRMIWAETVSREL